MVNYRAWPAGSAARGTCIRFQGRICPVARGLIERELAGRRRRYQRVLQIMRARMQPRIDRQRGGRMREGEREREREREGGKRWSLRPRARIARDNRACLLLVNHPALRPSRASFDPPACLRYRARRRRIALRIAYIDVCIRTHARTSVHARSHGSIRVFQRHRMMSVQLNRI